MFKLERPKDYSTILSACVEFRKGNLTMKQVDEVIAAYECNNWQFYHIMNQAKNLLGV